jgi:hypothetical protein
VCQGSFRSPPESFLVLFLKKNKRKRFFLKKEAKTFIQSGRPTLFSASTEASRQDQDRRR